MLAYGSTDAAGYHGRRTYELFAALWPSRAGEAGYIDRINALPKYVAGDADLRWGPVRRLADVRRDVTELKAEPGGDLVVYGGLGFVGALLELGLVDEYRVLVHPVLLGRGRGLIDEQAPRLDLAFAGLEALPGGVVVLSYRA